MTAKTVLIVEDNLDMRAMISIALQANQYSVTDVSCGQDALDYLQTNTPNLILLDMKLPDIVGEEFMTMLRKNANCNDTKVVVVSGVDDLAMEAKKIGADGWIKKPFDLAHLYREVEKYF